jgi:hypothetical protein
MALVRMVGPQIRVSWCQYEERPEIHLAADKRYTDPWHHPPGHCPWEPPDSLAFFSIGPDAFPRLAMATPDQFWILDARVQAAIQWTRFVPSASLQYRSRQFQRAGTAGPALTPGDVCA